MGIIKDNKTNTWTVRHSKRHPITRRPYGLRRIKIKTLNEARRVEKELIIKVNELIHRKTVPTWSKFLPEFYQNMKERDMSLKTVESYSTCLNAHTLHVWKDKCLDKITTHEIRHLVRERLSHKSENHQKNMLKFIRAVFTYALERGLINRNPCPIIKFSTNMKIKQVLTEEQAKTLLNQAKIMNNEWFPIWATALYTGMRSGELYALTWDKVDLNKRQILVDCSWNNKDGFKSTKSGDDRIVEIAPIKVMNMGGWKDLKTMQIYIRKAGVDIAGITNDLELHSSNFGKGNVLNFTLNQP